jgi:S1-C subfamily serine protease
MIWKSNDLHRIAEMLGGLPVLHCRPGSPSDGVMRYGDIILAVNGMPTPTPDAYATARGLQRDALDMRVFRDGREIDVRLELSASPA